ncbi:uncharacterized protein CTRU02_205463 [Colletotrichum truncatum]|uniref:Uncharacterized protein n=1 Tax=Colletotrichum truncatum TaxID=5467 RepID=A0ACC3Z430_COLTU|nr:uncharacterized protein CTRU02_04519 [Colletotrichum truncatum]KAF6795709.1 hypothetical protein CTRU02_04519 [Colletotrichum truncatum]
MRGANVWNGGLLASRVWAGRVSQMRSHLWPLKKALCSISGSGFVRWKKKVSTV